MRLFKRIFFGKAHMIWFCVPLLFSCATYNKSMDAYYSSVSRGDYDHALKKLEKNKFIKRNRNQLLYYLEAGNLYRLKNDPESSNRFFNLADDYIEASRKSVGDVVAGNLVNPMQQAYRGEDFEKFMVHYYKALNYAAMGKMDDAVVEARRITLSSNSQSDKFKNAGKRYSADAFALNLQGMIYEMSGDINNAFIAYRNAADVYLNHSGDYYGVQMPKQLKSDLLRTASLMGFGSEAERYEKLMNASYHPLTSSAGDIILFIEEGQAPVKEEKNFILTSVAGKPGNFSFFDESGYQSNFLFDHQSYGIAENKLSSVRTLRVAMPVYQVMYSRPASISVSANNISYQPELAEDLNTIAVSVLKERFLTELANALARQLTKKLVEKGAAAATEGIAKNQEKKPAENATDAEKEKKKKENEDKAKAAGEIAGLLVNVANTITEKADTRNWQSLPAYVRYVRIPLADGENIVTISANGKQQVLQVTGGKGLQMRNVFLN